MSDSYRDRYVRLRFERAVKLSREVVRSLVEARAPSQGLRLVRLYGDLLAQAAIDGVYSRVAEKRLIRHLATAAPSLGPAVEQRVAWLGQKLDVDWSTAESTSAKGARHKEGAISLETDDLNAWQRWLLARCKRAPGCILAILSRALTDASIAGRICGLPVRCLAHSRSRIGTSEPVLLDSEPLLTRRNSRLILLDAHSRTGSTLEACWRALRDRSQVVRQALVTSDETSASWTLPGAVHVKEAHSPWGAFEDASVSSSVVGGVIAAPLVALSGYPGSGKTLVRKRIRELTGWPVFSWSRVVRRLLAEEFGGLSMDAVWALTREEEVDAEFVAREFMVSCNLAEKEIETPIVIDGMKSVKALNFVARQLGRQAVVVRVARGDQQRKSALVDRADFDDSCDENRIAALARVGLPLLLDRASIRIDSSDSSVDRSTGTTHVGSVTSDGIGRVINEINRLVRE